MNPSGGGAQELDVGKRENVAFERFGVDGVGTAFGEHGEHALLLVSAGITHNRLHRESVHLRFRQIERTFFLDWILGGDHHERLRQRDAFPTDGRGAFGHRLEHRGLCFRVGTVDFVKQHEIRVDRADLRAEPLRGEVEDLGADQIGWHEVGGALHAFETA